MQYFSNNGKAGVWVAYNIEGGATSGSSPVGGKAFASSDLKSCVQFRARIEFLNDATLAPVTLPALSITVEDFNADTGTNSYIPLTKDERVYFQARRLAQRLAQRLASGWPSVGLPGRQQCGASAAQPLGLGLCSGACLGSTLVLALPTTLLTLLDVSLPRPAPHQGPCRSKAW